MKEHTSIYKEYKYNVCQNDHKTHVQEINVSKVERKEKKYIKSSLHPSNSTLPLTKISYSHIQNYSPILSRVTKGKSIK